MSVEQSLLFRPWEGHHVYSDSIRFLKIKAKRFITSAKHQMGFGRQLLYIGVYQPSAVQATVRYAYIVSPEKEQDSPNESTAYYFTRNVLAEATEGNGDWVFHGGPLANTWGHRLVMRILVGTFRSNRGMQNLLDRTPTQLPHMTFNNTNWMWTVYVSAIMAGDDLRQRPLPWSSYMDRIDLVLTKIRDNNRMERLIASSYHPDFFFYGAKFTPKDVPAARTAGVWPLRRGVYK